MVHNSTTQLFIMATICTYITSGVFIGRKKSSFKHTYVTLTARSATECCLHCEREASCHSVNFCLTDKTCELNDESPSDFPNSDVIATPKKDLYYVSTGCVTGTNRAVPGTNCTYFQTCLVTGDWGNSLPCSVGTLWNGNINTCDLENNVDPAKCVTNTMLAVACTAGESKGLTGCTEFVVCELGGIWSQVSMACPAGLLYNEDIQGCDNPSNVDLGTCTTI